MNFTLPLLVTASDGTQMHLLKLRIMHEHIFSFMFMKL